jgi:hypothetical protein
LGHPSPKISKVYNIKPAKNDETGVRKIIYPVETTILRVHVHAKKRPEIYAN